MADIMDPLKEKKENEETPEVKDKNPETDTPEEKKENEESTEVKDKKPEAETQEAKKMFKPEGVSVLGSNPVYDRNQINENLNNSYPVMLGQDNDIPDQGEVADQMATSQEARDYYQGLYGQAVDKQNKEIQAENEASRRQQELQMKAEGYDPDKGWRFPAYDPDTKQRYEGYVYTKDGEKWTNEKGEELLDSDGLPKHVQRYTAEQTAQADADVVHQRVFAVLRTQGEEAARKVLVDSLPLYDYKRLVDGDKIKTVEEAKKQYEDAAWEKFINSEDVKEYSLPATAESVEARLAKRAQEVYANYRPGGVGYVEQVNPDMEAVSAADYFLTHAKRNLADAEAEKNSSVAGSAVRGFVNGVWDIAKWDFGAEDLRNAKAVMDAINRVDAGTDTDQDRMLLDAYMLYGASQRSLMNNAGTLYKAMNTTAASIPFMLQMALSPELEAINAGNGVKLLKFLGSKFGQNRVAAAIEKIGNSAARAKLASMAASAWGKAGSTRVGKMAIERLAPLMKSTGTGMVHVGESLVGGAYQTLKFNSMNVAAESLNRQIGQVTDSRNSDGTITYELNSDGKVSRLNVEDGVTATGKAFAQYTFENGSELVGEYLAPFWSAVGKKGAKAVGLDLLAGQMTKIPGYKTISGLLDNMTSSGAWKEMKLLQRATRWDGNAGEYSEEVLNNFANAAFGIDGNFNLDKESILGNSPEAQESVFNLQKNFDTYMGVAVMGTLFNFAGAVNYAGRVRTRRGAEKELDFAESEGQIAFQDKWGEMTAMMDAVMARGGNATDLIVDNMKNGGTQEQRKAISRYFIAKARIDALDKAKAAMLEDDSEDAAEVKAMQAYDNGYLIKLPQDQNAAQSLVNSLGEKMAGILDVNEEEVDTLLGLDDDASNAADVLHAVMYDQSLTDDQRDVVEQYLNARVNYQGVLDRAADDINAAVQASNRQVNKLVNGQGQVQSAMTKDGLPVYLIRGNVQTDERGFVMPSFSDNSIIVYDPSTGATQMKPASELLTLNAPADATKMIEDQANRTRQMIAMQRMNAINGVLDLEIGDEYDMLNYDNTPVKIKVLQDAGDGVNVVVDMNGQQQVLPKETIQEMYTASQWQKMQDFLNASAEQKKAAAPSAQPTAVDKIPTTEDGKKNYEAAHPMDTYEALVEQLGGDEAVSQFVQMKIQQAAQAVQAAEQAKAQTVGTATDTDAQVKAAQASGRAVKSAKDLLDYWTAVGNAQQTVAKEREAEAQRKLNEIRQRAQQQAGTDRQAEGVREFGYVTDSTGLNLAKTMPDLVKLADILGKALKTQIVFIPADNRHNGVNHGKYIEVSIDAFDVTPETVAKSIDDMLVATIGHEVTHSLFRNADMKAMFVPLVKQYLGRGYTYLFNREKAKYVGAYLRGEIREPITDDYIDEEIAGNMAGQLLLDEDFQQMLINGEMAAKDSGMLDIIVNAINKILSVVGMHLPKTNADNLRDMQQAWLTAFQETQAKAQEGVMSYGGENKNSIRTEEAPKNVKKAYAVFVVKKDRKGKVTLHPKMISGDFAGEVPLVWQNAETGNLKRDENGAPIQNSRGRAMVSVSGTQGGGKTSNKLSWRPGKHMAFYPNAAQFKGKDKMIDGNIVFFEVEYAADIDYQLDAWGYGMRKNNTYMNDWGGLPYIPKDGYYIYKTNQITDGAAPMIITGAYRIVRAMTDAEAKVLNQKAGGMWCERRTGEITKEKLTELGVDDEQLKKLRDSYPYDNMPEPHDESEDARQLPGYVQYPINFDDANLQKVAKENGQDLEAYKEEYAKRNSVEGAAERLQEKGFEVDLERGDAKYSLKAVMNKQERKEAIRDLMRVTGRSRRVCANYVKSEESLAAVVFGEKDILELPNDPAVDVIWNNSDYPQGTVEFSNICKKRLPLTTAYMALQTEFPDVPFNNEVMDLMRQIFKNNGREVACAFCFVEDRRQLLAEIAKAFQESLRQGHPVGLASEKKEAEASTNENQMKAIDKVRESGDTYIPNLKDLLTLEGFRALSESHKEIHDAFVEFNNARGMQAARLFQAYSAYDSRQILSFDAKKVKNINNAGGLRIFSFSDFEAHHLLDLVQILTDCARMGIKVQGYTKQPEFAKAVKDTGMKVNRSLIPDFAMGYEEVPEGTEGAYPVKVPARYEKNVKIDGVKHRAGDTILDKKGRAVMETRWLKLKLDNVEGINTNDSNFFDSTDNKNIGNIIIGSNDTMTRLAMVDPMVDYIIGYHTGQGIESRKRKNVGHWTNYKDTQLDKRVKVEEKEDKEGNTYLATSVVNADKHGINIYTNILNGKYGEIKNKRQFVEAFIAEAQERGWIPRFYQFLNTKSGRMPATVTINKDGAEVYKPVIPVLQDILAGRDAFVYTEGYHKFPIDFKLFDKNGKICPQMPVVPKFNNEFLKEILDKYVADVKDAGFDQEIYDKVKEEFGKRGLLKEGEKASIKGVKGAKVSWTSEEKNKVWKDAYEYRDAMKQMYKGNGLWQDRNFDNLMSWLDDKMGFIEANQNNEEWLAGERAELEKEIKNKSRAKKSSLTKAKNNEDGGWMALAKADYDNAFWNETICYVNKIAIDAINKALEGKVIAEQPATRDLMKELGVSNRKTYTVQDLRSWFDKYNKDEENERLFNLIMPTLEKMGSGIQVKWKNPEKVSWIGSYSWIGKELRLRPSTFKSAANPNQLCKTILHECIHAVTSYAIGTWELNSGKYIGNSSLYRNIKSAQSQLPEGLIKAVEDLQKAYTELKDKKGIAEKYGAKSVHEMIAELANPAFREELKKQSLWERIIDGITRIIANLTGNEVEVNAYEALKRNLERFLENYDGESVYRAENINKWNPSVYQGQYDGAKKFSMKVTPEMDAEYMQAVKNGGMVKAQEMVDAASDAAGYTVPGFHGTTNRFFVFSKNKAVAEGNWGKGFYFTNNQDDVEENYANNNGADLTSRIERLAEILENEAQNEWDEETWMNTSSEYFRDQARKQLSEGDPHTIEAYLKMENPVTFGGKNETFFDMEYPMDEDGEYDYDQDPEGSLVDFIQALQDVIDDGVYRVDISELYEYGDGGLTASQLEDKARELLVYYENEDGDYAAGDAIREAFERMGFDGIVDNRVSKKFPGMGLDADTTHMIIFKPNQIKMSDPVTYDSEGKVIPLSQRFNEKSDDIRYSVKPHENKDGNIEFAYESDPKYSIRVWHGTAADFDKFDHSFMGSGEGAQMFGWGTYVSAVEKVSRHYAEVAKRNAEYRRGQNKGWGKNGVVFRPGNNAHLFTYSEQQVIMSLINNLGDINEVIKAYQNTITKTTNSLKEDEQKLDKYTDPGVKKSLQMLIDSKRTSLDTTRQRLKLAEDIRDGKGEIKYYDPDEVSVKKDGASYTAEMQHVRFFDTMKDVNALDNGFESPESLKDFYVAQVINYCLGNVSLKKDHNPIDWTLDWFGQEIGDLASNFNEGFETPEDRNVFNNLKALKKHLEDTRDQWEIKMPEKIYRHLYQVEIPDDAKTRPLSLQVAEEAANKALSATYKETGVDIWKFLCIYPATNKSVLIGFKHNSEIKPSDIELINKWASKVDGDSHRSTDIKTAKSEAWKALDLLQKDYDKNVAELTNGSMVYLPWDEDVPATIADRILTDAEFAAGKRGWWEDEGYLNRVEQYTRSGKPVKGSEIYNALVSLTGSQKNASLVLADVGLKGIKVSVSFGHTGNVRDQKNYVLFKEDDLKIVGHEKYSLKIQQSDPFYSNAAKAIEGIKQEKATGEQWLAMLKKNGGLKAEEDKWMGLSEWLKDRKAVTKDEVMRFISENAIKVEEVKYDENGMPEDSRDLENHPLIEEALDYYNDRFEELKDRAYEYREVDYDDDDVYETAAVDYAKKSLFGDFSEIYVDENLVIKPSGISISGWADPKAVFNLLNVPLPKEKNINSTRIEYTTEGLENKKEIALIVPNIEPYNQNDDVHFGDAGEGRAVAWLRFGDATATDGSKVMVIDEIQSKRHQDGREKGYGEVYSQEMIKAKCKEASNALSEWRSRMREKYGKLTAEVLTEEDKTEGNKILDEIRRWEDLRDEQIYHRGKSNVPDAPFQKNWHELVMKRALRYAAENGYDKVAWTTGMQQAARYDLGGVVEEIWCMSSENRLPENQKEYNFQSYADGKINGSVIVDTDTGIVIEEDGQITGTEGKPLSDVVGKEAAQKMLEAERGTKIDVSNLSVGGEGMKGFYDQMLPRYMDKYGKKWGVKTHDVELDLPNDADRVMHAVDVTPEMKESVMGGQPMFSLKGAPYAGNKGQIADDIIGVLPAGERFVDLFAGGGAMTHAALVSGKYGSVLMNDKNPVGMQLFLDGIDGKYEGYNRHVSKEEFAEIAGTPEGLLWSNNYNNRSYQGDRGLSRAKRVNELQSLKEYRDKISTSEGDYRDAEINPGDVLYADIPYEGTDNSAYRAAGKFDHRAFEQWAANLDQPVYVSSVEAPKGFTEIWSKEVKNSNHGKRTERLFVQDKFAGDPKYSIKGDPTKTDNFKRWFGDWEKDPKNASKVVDENGKPLVVHHGTNRYGFTVFKTGAEDNNNNIGSHFGGMDAAEEFVDENQRVVKTRMGIYNVYLNIRNPYNTYDWFAQDDAYPLHEAMRLAEKINTPESRKIIDDICKGELLKGNKWVSAMHKAYKNGGSEAAWDLFDSDCYFEGDNQILYSGIRDLLKMAGYDGLRYYNDLEGDGYCWVALEPTQIKSADTEGEMANNGDFDPNNPDIRYSIKEPLNTPEKYTTAERAAVIETGNRLNVKVNMIEDPEQIPADLGKNVKGWYDPKTGQVNVVIPNLSSMNDARKTVLHEAVAHYGLRNLLGQDRLDRFIKDLYMYGTDEVREAINEHLPDNGYHYGKATEEYFGRLAENDNIKQSVWDQIKQAFLDMLRAMGVNIRLTDNDVKYMLWKSQKTLENGDIFDHAEDIAKQAELGVGNYARYSLKTPAGYATDMARQQYEMRTANKYLAGREAWQDSMISLRELQDAIVRETGVPMQDFENAYLAENRIHGSSKNESEWYHLNFYKPMLDAVARLQQAFPGRKVSTREIEDYMMAKHGVERNVFFAFKQALDAKQQKVEDAEYARLVAQITTQDPKQRAAEEMKARRAAQKLARQDRKNRWTGLKTDIDLSTAKSDYEAGSINYADYIEVMKKRMQHYCPGTRGNLSNNEDYAGLQQLTGDDVNFEAVALQMVDDIERNGGANVLTEVNDLWAKVNAATKQTLKKERESGNMNREQYDYVYSMFDYYVPLRGWEDTTADQVYEYTRKASGFSTPLKKMKGRTSQADSPLAAIGNMAVSGIIAGNMNLMRQHFLRFVRNHPTSLATVSELWWENIGSKKQPEWIQRTPNITPDMSADGITAEIDRFTQDMHQKRSQGLATNNKSHLNIEYITIPQQEREHQVSVKEDGKEYIVYVNANPKAAQALNGTNKVKSTEFLHLMSASRKINRFFAENFTSHNPAFIFANLCRDLLAGHSQVLIKEDKKYYAQFEKNVMATLFKARMPRLLKKWKNGTLNENDEVEGYFLEFMKNGGETGYVAMLTVDAFKNNITKEIKKATGDMSAIRRGWGAFTDTVEFYNRAVEDTTRFVTFMTSRQMGKSLEQAIFDAKNISLNFDKKGTGGFGNAEFKDFFIFVNPAVQALQNTAHLIMKHPVKFTGLSVAYILRGMLQAPINEFMINLMGDDEDKDTYYQIPEWVRRNNLIIWIPGTHNFIKVPLSQEFRIWHSLGEMMMSIANGQYEGNPAFDFISSLSAMLPVDVTGNGGNIVTTLAPQALKPLAELYFNESFTGYPIYKDGKYDKYEPEFQRVTYGTPTWMTKLSEGLNRISGGYSHERGGIDKAAGSMGKYGHLMTNASVWNHMLNSYLGGIYSFCSQTAGTVYDAGLSIANKENNLSLGGTPILSRFATRPVEKDNAGRLTAGDRKKFDEAEEITNAVRKYKKEAAVGEEEAIERLDAIAASPEYEKAVVAQRYKQIIDKLRQAREMAETDKEKREYSQSMQELLEDFRQVMSEYDRTGE